MNKFSVKYFALSFMSIVSLMLFVIEIDPKNAGAIVYLIFFVLVFSCGLSFGSFIMFNLRKMLGRVERPKIALREGVFLGAIFVSLAFLGSQGLLWFWDAAFLIVTFIVLDIILLSSKKGNII